METICKKNCCDECPKLGTLCLGCTETNGRPCGGFCIAVDYILKNDYSYYLSVKKKMIDLINSLNIDNLIVNDLYLLNGDYINLEYKLNGHKFKLLSDKNIYWGNQIEIPNSDKCYGVACNNEFIIVSKYGCNGSDPELILFKKISLQ